MNLFTVHGVPATQIVGWGDNVFEIFLKSLEHESLTIEDNDIVVITSKVISMETMARAKLDEIQPGEHAIELAQSSDLDPRVTQLIIDESDGEIYGSVFHAVLSKTRFGLTANAGIDLSNCPRGYALLLPRDPDNDARRIRNLIAKELKKKVAVLITDSRTIPLKRGTTGVALGVAGMEPVIDERGKNDLYGYEMTITTRGIADNMATVANIVMGETSEQTPFAVIKGAEYRATDDEVSMDSTMMPEDQCLYFGPFIQLLHGEDKWL